MRRACFTAQIASIRADRTLVRAQPGAAGLRFPQFPEKASWPGSSRQSRSSASTIRRTSSGSRSVLVEAAAGISAFRPLRRIVTDGRPPLFSRGCRSKSQPRSASHRRNVSGVIVFPLRGSCCASLREPPLTLIGSPPNAARLLLPLGEPFRLFPVALDFLGQLGDGIGIKLLRLLDQLLPLL